MKYEELLREINDLNVSVLSIEQQKTLKEALQIKISCINFYQRISHTRKHITISNSKKCEN